MLRTPDDALRCARDDHIVYACITAWRAGHLTWDQAMLEAVCRLSEERNRLTQEVTRLLRYETPVLMLTPDKCTREEQ